MIARLTIHLTGWPLFAAGLFFAADWARYDQTSAIGQLFAGAL